MEYRVLGSLEVRNGEASVPLGGAKQRALLALLLLSANRVVARERLIDELWGEAPPETAVTTVQVYVSRLRKLLPPAALQTRSPGYVLEVAPEQLDLSRFEELLEVARHADPAAAARLLREALGLWRGPPLAEFEEPFALIERGRLEELWLAAVEDRIEADLALGRQAELVGELRALIAAHPHREHLHRQLMLALYRSGRQAEALEAYRVARAALKELGLEPGEELRELERAILTQGEALAPIPRTTNLPAQATPLIGRTHELADMLELVRANSLVTLTGAGGAGKTRLALEAAGELLADFADGVWFVSLAPLKNPDLVVPTIANVLGMRGDLHAFLRGKRLLLVLDNLEQLLPDVARTIAGLETTVLATSRERLNVAAEHEYPVSTLPLDDGVVLFTERARRLEPSFEPDDEVAEIVRHLDGLPLAIELAAARVKMLTPAQIGSRLSEGFDLLAGGRRDAPDRHRTLRATLEWSYDLLTESEQDAFARLGVFVGGCDARAAEAVASVSFDVLSSLVDKSLVGRDGTGRFFLLELIREYAAERLEESPGTEAELQRRHAEHLAAWAEDRAARRRAGTLFGARLAETDELENIRAALAWARGQGELELELRLAGSMGGYWGWSGSLSEGRAWLEDVLMRAGDADPALRASALERLAHLCWRQGDVAATRTYGELGRALFEELGDRRGVADCLMALAIAASGEGDRDAEDRLYDEIEPIFREVGEVTGLVAILVNRGYSAIVAGDYERAERLLRECEQLYRRQDGPYWVALLNLGLAMVALGRIAEAEAAFREAGEVALPAGESETLFFALEGLALVSAARERDLVAAQLWGASEAVGEATGYGLQPAERKFHEPAVPAARERAGADAFDRAWAEGRTLTPGQALAAAKGS